MAVKFFGQFLIEQSAITNQSLLRAIDLQEKNNLKIGEMAVAMGYITRKDIEKAHNAQLSKDMKLGDLLVELGLLNNLQLEEVIARQKATHMFLGEALVKVGALTADKLDEYLEAFKQDQAPYMMDRIALPNWLDQHNMAWEMVVDMTHKLITRVVGMQFRPGKFTEPTSLLNHYFVAAMDIKGDISARYLLSVSEGTQKAIAKAILKEPDISGEPEEVLDDTVMEFVNVVCGNVVAKGAQMGLELDIEPPLAFRKTEHAEITPADGQRCLVFPIHLNTDEKMELALFI
jgi:CheY-specific phosphatase CheX